MGSSEKVEKTQDAQVQCPVCHKPLSLRIAKGRKSGKPFINVVCPQDGRHFRAFIGEQAYVGQVIDRLKPHSQG
jgi:hypothetical protein